MASLNMNALLVRRATKVLLASSKTPVSEGELESILKEMFALGYEPSASLVKVMSRASYNDLKDIVVVLKNVRGDSIYESFYSDFRSVMRSNISDFELYVRAIIHYATGAILDVPVLEGPIAEFTEKGNLTPLSKGTTRDVKNIAKNLVTQGQSYSVTDKEDLTVLSQYITVEKVNIKENLVFLNALRPDLDWSTQYSTVRDVLRLAAALSNGDLTLTEKTRFKLTRAQRRIVLSLLEKILEDETKITDFARDLEAWKRLAYALHAGETKAFPKTVAAFDRVAKGDIEAPNSKVEQLISSGKFVSAARVLPASLLARRLSELLRKASFADRELILDEFKKKSRDVSIPVLVQMYNYFNGPTADVAPERVTVFTGAQPNRVVRANSLTSHDEQILSVIREGLRERLASTKVFISDEVKGHGVPLGLRSTSEGLRVLARGTRVPLLEDAKYIRAFMNWKNMKDGGRVDLDLSAFFINEAFTSAETVAYYNLRANMAYHSGDITSAPNGAAEYIDVNIDEALKSGHRYLAISVYNYTGQPLKNVPEAWAGVMERENLKDGKNFEPRSVTQKFSLTSESRSAFPMLVDLKTREIVWIDLPVSMSSGAFGNADNNIKPLAAMTRYYAHSNNLTIGEFVELIATPVDSPDKADVVFTGTEVEQLLQLL